MYKLTVTFLLSLLLISGLSFVPATVFAGPYEVFEFDSPEKEKLFHKLSEELRCVVCQNQSIAESNAELAQDLRQKIYTMLSEGKSEREITDFMVQRYGDFVLYRPPVEPKTWLLWFGPFIAFVIGLIFVVRFLIAQSEKKPAQSLTDEDLERVKNLHAQQGGEKK